MHVRTGRFLADFSEVGGGENYALLGFRRLTVQAQVNQVRLVLCSDFIDQSLPKNFFYSLGPGPTVALPKPARELAAAIVPKARVANLPSIRNGPIAFRTRSSKNISVAPNFLGILENKSMLQKYEPQSATRTGGITTLVWKQVSVSQLNSPLLFIYVCPFVRLSA